LIRKPVDPQGTGDLHGPVFNNVGDEVAMLDPRAIITDVAGQIYYGPSSIPLEKHSKEMAEWIEANPDWEREPSATV
jgi:hypothetical protein